MRGAIVSGAECLPQQAPDAVYDSVAALLEALDGPARVAANKRSQERCGTTNQPGGNLEWHGLSRDARRSETPTGAVRRLLVEGWPRGVELMEAVRSGVEVPDPISVRRRGVWDAEGAEVDMQRVYAGALDTAWRRTKRLAGRGPQRVRLLVDSIASGGANADSMRWRGVAALVAADALTAAGYSVQVESTFRGGSEGIFYTPRCIVKPYQSPLDLSTLAATTALPAFFRALWHNWHYIAAPEHIGSCGYAVSIVQLSDCKDQSDSAPMFLSGQSIDSAEAAQRWVAETIGAINALVTGEAAA